MLRTPINTYKVFYHLIACVAIYFAIECGAAIATWVVAVGWGIDSLVVLLEEYLLDILLLVHLVDGATLAVVVYHAAAVAEDNHIILIANNMIGICRDES